MANRVSPWREPLWSAVISAGISLVVFLPIAHRWASAWAPGDMLSTYNNAAHWGFLGYAATDRAGFPGGMNLNLFPGVDITQNAAAALIGLFSSSPFLGINLVVILSFPLTAALTAVAMRLVGLRGWWAIALAVSYSLIPYHFGRALGHAYLSTMFAAVTGLILALIVGTGRWQAMRLTSLRTWLAVGPLVLVTAWSGIYYAAFGVLLIAAAVTWRFIGGASARQTLVNLVPLLLVTGVTMVGLIPSALARIQEDVGSLGERPPYESVVLAGSLAMALVPAPISLLPRMGYVNEAILSLTRDAPFSEAIQVPNFGTWITTGCMVLAALWSVRQARHGERIPRVLALLFFLLIVVVLFFVPWGMNSLFAEFITAQIRAWNRLVPTLLLIFLLMGAVAIARMGRLHMRPWAALGPAVILVVVLVEQALPFRALFAENATRYGRDTDMAFAYARDVNAAIPQPCGVLQLPYMIYPENGAQPPRLNDYEHFWQSLTNPDKSWSYGAVRGSASADVAQRLAARAEAGDTQALVDAGICAIHLDRRGYRADRARAVVDRLTVLTGPPIVTGLDGEWLLFAVPPGG